MKVYIGKYPSTFDLDTLIPLKEDHPWKEKISDFLYGTFLGDLVRWYNTRERKIVVKNITRSDTYSLNSTLAEVILPALKKFKEDCTEWAGYPCQFEGDNPDIPEDLKDADGLTKWKWVIDEMIFAFEQELDDTEKDKYYDHSECSYMKDDEPFDVDNFMDDLKRIKVDWDGLRKYNERVQRGFEFFGKYYQNLWW